MKKLILNLLGVLMAITAINAQTTIYSESFEDTLGWTLSHKFDDGFEDYILHDSVVKINARTNGPDFTIHGADSAFVIAFEDINSGDPGSVSSNGFAEIKIDSIPVAGYDSLKVWLAVAANPTSNRYDNALNSFGNGDSLGVWASIDGGAYSRIMFFCAPDSNAAKTSSSNTGSLYFDSNLNFIGGDANDIAIDDTLESFSSMVNGKGSYMSIRVLLRTESGDEEIVLDNFRVQGVKSTTCNDPSKMATAQLSTSSYQLGWNSVSNLSNIEYGTQGFTQGSGTVVKNLTSPYVLTGLMPGQSYDIYYQDTCTGIGTSNWVGPVTITVSAAPTVLDIWRTSSTSIMVAYSDSMASASATSTSRYKGIAGLANVSLNSGNDTATLTYGAPFVNGIMNTLTVDSTLSATGVLLDTSYMYSFIFNNSKPNIVITEMMYNDLSIPDTLEYLEIHNAGTGFASVGGMTFTRGINFTVPANLLLPAGAYIVLSKDSAAFKSVFGLASIQWTSGSLTNGGELVMISNTEGDTIDMVDYKTSWINDANGGGSSMVLCDVSSDNNVASSWGTEPVKFSSTDYFASPGAANTCRPPFIAPQYDIATVTTQDTNGLPDSNEVICWLTGTVFSLDYDGNTGLSFYMTDGTGGINVFNRFDIDNYVVRDGDSLRVRGEIAEYNGLTELVVDSIRVLDSNKTYPAAKVVTGVDESTESEFIKLENVYIADTSSWPDPGRSANVELITQGGDTITMRIDSDTDVDEAPAPLCLFTIAGIGNQFDGSKPRLDGYQIFARYLSDIKEAKAQIGAVANITSNGADVDWTAVPGTSNWNIGWAKGHSSTSPTDSVLGITSNPYSLTGLDTNTPYNIWIQDVCNGRGEWNGPIMFSTEQDTTGVEEFNSIGSLVAFPNPNNSGSLRINRVTDVIIRNLLGEPVIVKNATDEIDINELARGVYLLEAKEGDTIKLIVE